MLQYPLKEVVVVNEDNDFLRDVELLREYILEVCLFTFGTSPEYHPI